MRSSVIILAAVLAVSGAALAQERAKATPNDLYCSGVVSTTGMSRDFYVISGEESYLRNTFAQGDKVFLNRGSAQGVRVGDQFLLSRPVKDSSPVRWFSWQPQLMRAMGTLWADVGRVRVVEVQANVAIAEVVFTCEQVQRGDFARPFVEMASPNFPPRATERFAPPSGKNVGMVVFAKNYGQMAGTYNIVYVNLGSAQGVRVGDHIRLFRHQNSTHETAYRPRNTAWTLWGYGSAPARYSWNDLPREILGHGVVLRVGENAATVLLTSTLKDIYLGDYAEVK